MQNIRIYTHIKIHLRYKDIQNTFTHYFFIKNKIMYIIYYIILYSIGEIPYKSKAYSVLLKPYLDYILIF